MIAPNPPSDPKTTSCSEDRISQATQSSAYSQQTTRTKVKDGWDKAGVVAQFLSGVVIAGIGFSFTYFAHKADLKEKDTELQINTDNNVAQRKLLEQQTLAQMKLSEKQHRDQIELESAHNQAELDLENRKNISDYAGKLDGAVNSERRVELLGHMVSALQPDESIRLAMDYAHPPSAMYDWDEKDLAAKDKYDGKKLEFDTALQVLNRLKKDGVDELRRMSKTDIMPDKEIARALLGQPTRVWVKASGIDDWGDLNLNGKQIVPRLAFQQDSGWIDITKNLEAGDNFIEFIVSNGDFGGFGGRLQISAGLQQYDTGLYLKRTCPCKKPAFGVSAHIKLRPNGYPQLLDMDFTQFPS